MSPLANLPVIREGVFDRIIVGISPIASKARFLAMMDRVYWMSWGRFTRSAEVCKGSETIVLNRKPSSW